MNKQDVYDLLDDVICNIKEDMNHILNIRVFNINADEIEYKLSKYKDKDYPYPYDAPYQNKISHIQVSNGSKNQYIIGINSTNMGLHNIFPKYINRLIDCDVNIFSRKVFHYWCYYITITF